MEIKLKDRIWNIAPDEDWESLSASVHNHSPKEKSSGREILRVYLEKVLNEIHLTYSDIDSSHIALTGVRPGKFIPVASINRPLKEIPESPQDLSNISEGRHTLASKFLLNDSEEFVKEFICPNLYSEYVGPEETKSKILVKLLASGELFGYISLDTNCDANFPESLESELMELQPFLSRMIAESVFTLRLWQLSKPLYHPSVVSIDELCQDIVDRALLTFGASGCVLRLQDHDSKQLELVAYSSVDQDIDFLIEELSKEGSSGQEVCQMIFESENFDWSIDGRVYQGGSINGLEIPDNLRDDIANLDIACFSVFRLDSNSAASSKALGTLSIFHTHPTKYSWRDIALAKQLVKRAADVIALHLSTIESQEIREALEQKTELLEIESQMTTRAEIVTLLSHDLGHKAFAVNNWFDKYVTAVKKALKNNNSFASIEKLTADGEAVIASVLAEINTINRVFSPSRNDSFLNIAFNLKDAIEEVVRTLKPAMNRNGCDVRINNIERNIQLVGNKNVFLLVLFNLLINSVDAQKQRRKPSSMMISISASYDKTQNKLIMSYGDNGPGINRTIFPDANDVFLLGKSSKGGTGRGLPISRSLLGQFFGADLLLIDPSKALFKISFPNRSFNN